MDKAYDVGAEFYDYVPSYRARPDAAFYVEQARRAAGPVLELGCGAGRVLIPIAQSGVEIMGLDKSGAMLALCRARLADEPEAVRRRTSLARADMRGFDLGRQFALITTPFRSFQRLVTVQDQLACLDAVRRHLLPGGRFILDLFNPSLDALARQDFPRQSSPEPEFSLPDGRRVVRRDRTLGHDRLNQVLEVELRYDVTGPDGSQTAVTQRFQQRYLFRYEAEHLLARAGFDLEAVYSDFDERPFGTNTVSLAELILVARSQPEPA